MLLLLQVPAVLAHTQEEVDLVCPLDGEKFKQVLSMSGTRYGQMLDLKPFGPTVAPWPLPVCPTSGFVVYRHDFQPDEIERFRTFVATPEYAAARTETPYFRVAKLQTFLGEDRSAVALSLLQATWEAESPDQYARYARDALELYRGVLSNSKQEGKRWPLQQLVAGELERRLGLFEEARARFTELRTLEQFRTGVFARMVDLQLRLIDQRDTTSHQIPRKGP